MGLLNINLDDLKKGRVKRSERQYDSQARNITSLLDDAANFVPVVSGVKGAKEELEQGNVGMGLLNAATVPLDVLSLGGASALKAAAIPLIFAGKGAKTFDALKAAKAEKMIADGVDRATVWKETGYGHAPWQKPGTDAAVRHELDDSKAVFEKPFRQPTSQEVSKAIEAQDFIRSIDAAKKEARNQHGYTLKGFYDARPGDYEKYQKAQEIFRSYNRDFVDPKIKQGYLADFLDHNEAYAAYPKTSIIPTTYNQAHSGGSYAPEMNQMLLGLGDEKSVTLHELQHAIQQREGWARGGSPEMFRETNASMIPEMEGRLKAVLDIDRLAKAHGVTPMDVLNSGAIDEPFASSLKTMDLSHPSNWDSIVRYSKERLLTPDDAYRHLAGEAEARLTQYRMNLTPEERLAQYPYDPEYFKKATGVDINDLIVRNGDGVAMSQRPLTEFEQRHLTAQKNAALPVEQGGLGLPADNTAMDRARAMGMVTAPRKTVFHATDTPWESTIVDPSKSDFGFHVGTPEQANARIMSRGKDGVSYREGANVMPLMVNKYANLLKVTDEGTFHADALAPQLVKKGMLSKEQAKVIDKEIGGIWDMDKIAAYDQQMRDLLAKNGYDGVKYKNAQEGEGMSYAFSNPSMVRSRFAAFDPMRRHEADLLGYADPSLLSIIAGGGLLGLGGYSLVDK